MLSLLEAEITLEAKGMVPVEKCDPPFLGYCSWAGWSFSAFLRYLPPMPEDCLQLRPGLGPGSM